MKTQKMVMAVLFFISLGLLIIVIVNGKNLQSLNRRQKENEEELERLETEISLQNVIWESLQGEIAEKEKQSASYEFFFQREDRAELARESLQEVLHELQMQHAQERQVLESLRAVWESLCDELDIPYETLPKEDVTEPEGEYDE